MSSQPKNTKDEYTTNAYQSAWIYALTSSIIVFAVSMIIGNLNAGFLQHKYMSKIVMVIAIFAAHYILNVFINTDNDIKKCEAINSSVFISWVVLGTLIYFGISSYFGGSSSGSSSSQVFARYNATQYGGGGDGLKDSLMYAAIVGIITFFLSLSNRPIMRTVGACKTMF